MDHHHHHIVSDEVLVNGIKTPLTLSTDGTLRWLDRCLFVEKEVLGLLTSERLITITALVNTGDAIGCSRRRNLVRKRFVFESLSDDSLRNLCDKIQTYIDSLGNCLIF